MNRVRVLAAAVLTAAAAASAGAQMSDTARSHADSLPQPRRVEGRVVRGTRAGRTGVGGTWVVLHRVGPDRAGPLDSTRTRGDGGFRFDFRTSGSPDAVYFVSSSFGGIAYFSAPLTRPVVRGDDATIVVFDTATAPGAIHVGGHHVIIGAAQPDGRRPVGEVYDLQNDSTVTVIAHDSMPVFVAHLPAGAESFRLNPDGDIAPAAVTRRGSEVGLFAPISPGVRQLAFTYELPSSAFPLSIPIERPTAVLEVLVQETGARVNAPNLREVAPVTTEGRTFRRFMGDDEPLNAVLRVDAPDVSGGARTRTIAIIAAILAVLMIVAGAIAVRRRIPRRTPATGDLRPHDGVPAEPERESERLVREIAELDAEHETTVKEGAASNGDYEMRRAALKQRLADAIASERQRA